MFTSTKKASWYQDLYRSFWVNPDRLLGAKATIGMALAAIPFEILGLSFFAVTISLGVLTGALSETDDHPIGRIKSLALKVLSFGVSSLSVELLRPWPVWLGIGLGVSTIIYILLGGTGERYRGVTFGAILVGIYTMIGAEISPAWYWQPLLLSGGALLYGLVSLALLYFKPYRLLDEQLARGFLVLAKYLDEKSRLFPSDKEMQGEIRSKLALLNVEMVNTLERIKEVLNTYQDALGDERTLKPWFHYFMVLQGLHERAASSHEHYDLLSNESSTSDLVEVAGQALHELSLAARRFSKSLLTGTAFQHPVALKWILASLVSQFETQELLKTHPFRLLVRNLERANISFQLLTRVPSDPILPRLAKDDRSWWRKFREQLSFQHPRMRYAIRLALCFMIGIFISEAFQINKGEWIVLTILFVLQPSYSATRRRLFQRILGTITGVVAGVIIVKLLTLPGQVALMFVSAFLFFVWLKKEYSVSVIFITVFVLCAFNLISGSGLTVMLPRLVDTLIGAILALVIVRLLWPQWQYKKLPGLLNNAWHKNTLYFRAILDIYKGAVSEDDLEYRIARRQAHQADNALALTWQDMQSEPRKYQEFRHLAFKMTYLNHALLSFISAFAAHREDSSSVGDEVINAGSRVFELLESQEIEQKKEQGFTINKVQDLLSSLNDAPEHVLKPYTVLYNIADITGQLLCESKQFYSMVEYDFSLKKV